MLDDKPIDGEATEEVKALDEGDIAILKTYVSSSHFRDKDHMAVNLGS